jgi:cytoplasmic iron level regulating protein YaaA (DUF328/UPF0246 family)
VLTILLPPSEGKAAGGRGRPWSPDLGRFGAELAAMRGQVAAALHAVDGGDADLLHATGDLLEQARRANRQIVGAPTMPAGRRFSGVVWEHLALPTLSTAAKRRAARSVIVVSAVAGLSSVNDPLPDFRLKLSARLDPLGKLSTWWRPELSAVLDATMRRRLVIDLLPHEHAAAWTPRPDRYDLRRISFVDRGGKPIGHNAKMAKGRLARALLEADEPEAVLRDWTHPDLRLEITSS